MQFSAVHRRASRCTGSLVSHMHAPPERCLVSSHHTAHHSTLFCVARATYFPIVGLPLRKQTQCTSLLVHGLVDVAPSAQTPFECFFSKQHHLTSCYDPSPCKSLNIVPCSKSKGGGAAAAGDADAIRAIVRRVWGVMNLGSAYEINLRVAALECFNAILPPVKSTQDVSSLARGVRVPSNNVKLTLRM